MSLDCIVQDSMYLLLKKVVLLLNLQKCKVSLSELVHGIHFLSLPILIDFHIRYIKGLSSHIY